MSFIHLSSCSVPYSYAFIGWNLCLHGSLCGRLQRGCGHLWPQNPGGHWDLLWLVSDSSLCFFRWRTLYCHCIPADLSQSESADQSRRRWILTWSESRLFKEQERITPHEGTDNAIQTLKIKSMFTYLYFEGIMNILVHFNVQF